MERTDSARTVKSEAELDMIRKGNARRMFRSRENMSSQKKQGTWVKDQKRRRRERERERRRATEMNSTSAETLAKHFKSKK